MGITIDDYIGQNGKTFLEEFLIQWLKIPSVSLDEDLLPVGDASLFLGFELKKIGFNVQYELESTLHPVLYAEKIVDPNLPTVLFYGHCDVQPMGDISKWVHGDTVLNPFEPVIIDGKIYARGVADDKGQVAAQILALKCFEELPCNIKVIYECDEESGKPTIHDFIARHREQLACDVAIISDTDTLVEGTPALTTSLKGIVKARIKADTPEALLKILANSYDYNANATQIPGFYDALRTDISLSPDVAALLGKNQEGMGLLHPKSNPSFDRLFRPTNSPLYLNYVKGTPVGEGTTFTLTTHGPDMTIHSGQFGGPVHEPALLLAIALSELDSRGIKYEIDYLTYGDKTGATKIYPTAEAQITITDINRGQDVSGIKEIFASIGIDSRLIESSLVTDRNAYQAHLVPSAPEAVLSYRLVSDQDATLIGQSIDNFVSERGGKVVELDTSKPFMTYTTGSLAQLMIASMKRGYDSDTVHITGSGGSIPVALTLRDVLNVPVLLAGFSGPNSNIHGERENMEVNAVYQGAKTIAYFLQELGKQ